MKEDKNIPERISALEQEMKRNGLWQKDPPEWVTSFDDKTPISLTGFTQWLQFVFVPNYQQYTNFPVSHSEKKSIVPSAIKFLGEDARKGKLLQLLIEIDSLL